MTVGADIMEQFMLRYGPPAGEDGPIRFVQEVFGVTPDPWQEVMLRAYGRGDRKITVAACHGPGKTACAAWCAAHQLVCRFPQVIGVTAPTVTQMYDAFYKELKIWLKKLPPALYALLDIKAERIELVGNRESSFLSAKTAKAEQPEALAGLHCEGGFVLLIVDEASGVPESIFEAATGSMSGEHVTMMLLGNPIRTTGYFFNSHTSSLGWTRIHITAVAEEHYDPGTYFSARPGPLFVQQVVEEFGFDTNPYRVRVLGLFPRSDHDTIIPFEWVEAATVRDIRPNPGAAIVWGVDVARGSGDLSTLCKRQQNRVLEPIRFKSDLNDTMLVVGWVKAEWDMTPLGERPIEICVDVIGLGAGVVDRLREQHLPCRGVNVAESPALDGSRFRNLRTELWFAMRDWFGKRDCWIPKDDKLVKELTAQKYKALDSSGMVIATPKDMMRKVIKRSPDRADAFGLTFATTATGAMYGQQQWSWDKPVLRNAAVV